METDSPLEAMGPFDSLGSPTFVIACALAALALSIACALLWRSRARLSRDLELSRAQARQAREERDRSLENETRLARAGMLQRVAAGLAFDLNNPLAVIQGAALILRARLERAARPRGEPIAAVDLLRECDRVERAVAKMAGMVRLYREVPALARTFDGPGPAESALAAPGDLEALVESRAQFHGVTLIRLEPAAISSGGGGGGSVVASSSSTSAPATVPGLAGSGSGDATAQGYGGASGFAGPANTAGVLPFPGLLRASVLCLCETIFEALARGPRERRFATMIVRRSRDTSEIEISHKAGESGDAARSAVGKLAPALSAAKGLELLVDDRMGEKRYLVRAKP